MPATTIAPYGRHGQKDVCFCRMLKKAAPEEDRYLADLVCLVCPVKQGQLDELDKPDKTGLGPDV